MKKILVIDACVRKEESRTKKMLNRALETLGELHPDWEFEILPLVDLNLNYWTTDTLRYRDERLSKKDYENPLFSYGNQFREADAMVVAAPFWDLSVPAVLKVYIENVSADGITFQSTSDGLKGLCHSQWMLFLTTRGGLWEGTDQEQGSRYMEALCSFFGIDSYYCVHADGIDIKELDGEAILQAALEETEHVCRGLTL